MTPTEIATIVAVAAFVVLVIFLVKVLINLSATIKKLTETLDYVQLHIVDMGHEPKELINNANQISADINYKLKCLDPLFRVVANVGEGIEHKTLSKREALGCQYCNPAPKASSFAENNDTTMQGIDLVVRAIYLWQNYKRRK